MNKIEFGDCREIMSRWIWDGVKAQTCVTSPPYFGLRDYGVEGQMGSEGTIEEYINVMREVFGLVRDLLADDGTLWLNMGDSYGHGTKSSRPRSKSPQAAGAWTSEGNDVHRNGQQAKQLLGVPWRLAFALQADGWYLRQDIIWHKPNPMPESVTDRCTKAHEYIFLLTKRPKYYFNATAIEEPAKWERWGDQTESKKHIGTAGHLGGKTLAELPIRDKKNKRDVWTIPTKGYKGAHFACFPPDLIEPCVLAGSRSGDIVFDPFMGSGTTAEVALKHKRQYLGCELNPKYEELQQKRIQSVK